MENTEVNALILMELFEKQESKSLTNVLQVIRKLKEQLENENEAF